MKRPEGKTPRSNQECPLCYAAPGVEHDPKCPWRLWAEGEAEGNCPTCGSPVHVVTGDEGTSHYEFTVASLLYQRDDRIMDLAAKLSEAEEKAEAAQERMRLELVRVDGLVRQRDERIAELEEVVRTGGLLRNDLLGRIAELETALEDACEVAIWLSGSIPDEAQKAWQKQMRPKLYRAMEARAALAGSGDELGRCGRCGEWLTTAEAIHSDLCLQCDPPTALAGSGPEEA